MPQGTYCKTILLSNILYTISLMSIWYDYFFQGVNYISIQSGVHILLIEYFSEDFI